MANFTTQLHEVTTTRHRAYRWVAAFVFLTVLALPFFGPRHHMLESFVQSSSMFKEQFQDGYVQGLLAIPTAQAGTNEYAAEVAARSFGGLRLKPGESVTFWVDYRNTGTATWKNTGDRFIALNVTDPAGRSSAFRHSFWLKSYRPAKLLQTAVAPGEIGRVRFAIKAPETPGQYDEHFQLVAENYTWISGSTISLPITVTDPLQAQITEMAYGSLTLQPNQSVTFWVDYKNTGTMTWTNNGAHFIALNVTDPAGRASTFRHPFWPLAYRPGKLVQDTVAPGDVGRVRFALQAPATPGYYEEHFQLVAENLTWIPGSVTVVPVTVVDPSTQQVTGEPTIRVGVRSVAEPLESTADGPFALQVRGSVAARFTAGDHVVLSYAGGTYTAATPQGTFSGTEPYALVPDPATIMELVNFESHPAWNTALNDNRFRGSITLQYASATGRLWIIDSLPLDLYLRGVAEASNGGPAEYTKALYTAARSYAYYHFVTGTKHAAENFTVDATYDQVYRGYGFELRSPTIVAAIDATKGYIVTYNGDPVVTPYFSQSDGRTRSWEEVWVGGPYPWLVTKSDPCCATKPLLGHGVGMSALGAYTMATNGSTFDAILSYYYSLTAVTKLY